MASSEKSEGERSRETTEFKDKCIMHLHTHAQMYACMHPLMHPSQPPRTPISTPLIESLKGYCDLLQM